MKTKTVLYNFLFVVYIISFNSCTADNSIKTIISTPKSHTLILQPNSKDGKDALLSSILPSDTINYGNYPTLEIICWTTGGVLNINRALIEFDLSSIPVQAIIDSSFISLFFGSSTNVLLDSHKGDNKMWIQRVVEPWDESLVTWNTQPKSDTRSTIWIESFNDNTQNYENIDITYLVKDIIKSKVNYGFIIKLQDESPWRATVIASSDHPVEATHPKLIVYYTN
ncbi:MAG: DNRLRE domain-containing protein [Bacteroidetes bacterium]|nr:DNRLRE domain-containing protein [Bacteroidota bacterium]